MPAVKSRRAFRLQAFFLQLFDEGRPLDAQKLRSLVLHSVGPLQGLFDQVHLHGIQEFFQSHPPGLQSLEIRPDETRGRTGGSRSGLPVPGTGKDVSLRGIFLHFRQQGNIPHALEQTRRQILRGHDMPVDQHAQAP